MISINLYEMLFQAINFGVLVWLLHRFFSKPLSQFLDKRAAGIETDIKEAADNKKTTAEIKSEAQAKLKAAQQEAQEIRQRAEKSAETERETVLNKAKEEAKAIIENANKDIAQELKRAEENLSQNIVQLSVKMSEKLIKKSITEDDKSAILKDFAGELKN